MKRGKCNEHAGMDRSSVAVFWNQSRCGYGVPDEG